MKKAISLAITLCMVIGLMPMSALAILSER